MKRKDTKIYETLTEIAKQINVETIIKY